MLAQVGVSVRAEPARNAFQLPYQAHVAGPIDRHAIGHFELPAAGLPGPDLIPFAVILAEMDVIHSQIGQAKTGA